MLAELHGCKTAPAGGRSPHCNQQAHDHHAAPACHSCEQRPGLSSPVSPAVLSRRGAWGPWQETGSLVHYRQVCANLNQPFIMVSVSQFSRAGAFGSKLKSNSRTPAARPRVAVMVVARQTKKEALLEAKKDVETLIKSKHCHPIVVRLAWHDSGSFDKVHGALFCGRADVVACALFAGGSALVPMPLHVKCRQPAVLAGEGCGPGGNAAAWNHLEDCTRRSRCSCACAGRQGVPSPRRGERQVRFLCERRCSWDFAAGINAKLQRCTAGLLP
jgi:hypothetical protein